MARRLGVVGAGILLVAGAGCSGDCFLLSFSRASPQQIVISGSVVEVSMRLLDAMTNAGIQVTRKNVGEEMRLAGVTKTKKVFCFHLTQDAAEVGAKTRVNLVWDQEADEEFWRTIVLPLAPVGPS